MNIEIRRAVADDAAFLSRIMLIAARSHVELGIWDVVVEHTEEVRLEFLRLSTLTEKRHMIHYSNFIVLEVDGRPAAALSGYSPDIGMDSFMASLGEVIEKMKWSEDFVKGAMERGQPYLLCHFDEPPDTWIVENVATLPDFRRMGLINKLLTQILDLGRERGFPKTQVSAMIGNTPAIRAYEKAGFQITEQITHPDFEAIFGEPGTYRLTRKL